MGVLEYVAAFALLQADHSLGESGEGVWGRVWEWVSWGELVGGEAGSLAGRCSLWGTGHMRC